MAEVHFSKNGSHDTGRRIREVYVVAHDWGNQAMAMELVQRPRKNTLERSSSDSAAAPPKTAASAGGGSGSSGEERGAPSPTSSFRRRASRSRSPGKSIWNPGHFFFFLIWRIFIFMFCRWPCGCRAFKQWCPHRARRSYSLPGPTAPSFLGRISEFPPNFFRNEAEAIGIWQPESSQGQLWKPEEYVAGKKAVAHDSYAQVINQTWVSLTQVTKVRAGENKFHSIHCLFAGYSFKVSKRNNPAQDWLCSICLTSQAMVDSSIHLFKYLWRDFFPR